MPTPDYELGLIPHYTDAKDPRVERLRRYDSVNVIDVMKPVAEVVAEVMRCRAVASSSLHGIILADTLSIPSRWLRISDTATRDGFKFLDYFQSIGRNEERPLDLTDTTTPAQILSQVRLYEQELDLGALLEACPFRREEITDLGRLSTLRAV